MVWGVPFKTYPLTVLISLATTVIPGVNPSMTIFPLLSVTYCPFPPPTGFPLVSVIRKVTPGRGVVVPSTYL